MNDKIPHELIDAAVTFLQGLMPATFGAAVAQMVKKGLSWPERITQMAVGITVSWFITQALIGYCGLDPFVSQAIGFVIAMIGYEATPRFIAGAGDAVGALPGVIKDAIAKRTGGN